MSATNKKVPGGHYSGMNKIPNIQQFIENLDKDKKERDAKIDADAKGKPQDEVKDHVALAKNRNRKTVTDPTTGKDVVIEDVDPAAVNALEDKLNVPNANLNRRTPVKTESTQSGEEYRKKQDITAPPDPVEPGSTSDVPIHGEKTNILFHPTPAVSFEPMYGLLETHATGLAAGVFFAITILGKMFGGKLYGLIPLACCVASGLFLWMKEVIRQGRAHEWTSERERGKMATVNLIPESVEWINTFMGIMWGLIDPAMFLSVADMMEDIMQASVPGVIENVRVAEIDQGTTPFRLLSLRALPDNQVQELKDDIRRQNQKNKDPEEIAADEQGGDYYNIEASFAYHAAPSSADTSSKAKNMHMQLVFYLGVKGLFGVPLPIFVELQDLVGTVRLRLQLSPEPPFLKALTFTLMGVPQVQAGCTPMLEAGVNILNLPLISNFVNYAIKTACSEYVAPKSLTLDMTKMLQGDDIQKDTEALGILWIRIHKATNLSKQDRRGTEGGGSDPYITVSFSKYGKPMYCTRVIEDNLNPVWEETCALLVTPALIKADEQLSMELWDSDRSTSDDIVGKVELSMQKMIQHPGKMYSHVSKLRGMDEESSMPGELHWEVGFFGKPKFRPELRTDGKDITLPQELRDKKELQDEKGMLDNDEEDAVAHTPPDPLWPSGICSVVIHQIVNLELQNIKGSEGKRKGREYEPAQHAGENINEESKKMPNSYCIIHFNDELTYRTRSKVLSSKPIFNAGTERFIRDWRSAIVTITVRDQRMREHDPVLGVVPLRLADLLQTSCQVTRWYPLDGGIGFGRIRVSLLFRSVETRLPPQQLGWDVGTFEFTSDNLVATGYNTISKIKMRTGGSSGSIKRNQCKKLSEGDGISWDILKVEGKSSVRLPVKYRYRSPIVFELHSASHRNADAYAIIWLHHFEDNKEQDVNIPIWKTDKGIRLTQNYITEENFKDIPDIKIEEVGRLHFRGRFKAGMDEDHAKFVVDNDSRETQETWEICHSEGVRGRVVTNEIPESIKKLHEESLLKPRDIFANADENDKKKWLSKDGSDWSGAFSVDQATVDAMRNRTSTYGHRANGAVASGINSDEGIAGIDQEGDYQDNTSSDSSDDLGIHDATTDEPQSSDRGASNDEDGSVNGEPRGPTHHNSPLAQYKSYKENERALHRQQRGLMQWKPMRNVQFAKDEAKYAVRRTFKLGGLKGREPQVQSEIG
ncbi:hypothetical protein F5884DRAFT_728173 [Xylogone sp. PMI_703]|nr:hypothetical protein F5884DRAFT_728173 [Xylogone sp. PMI_703]